MTAVLLVLGLWLLFGGTHVLLATAPIRARLVARWGERRFVAAYSALAMLLFIALVAGYSTVRTEGPPGLALGASPWTRWPLVAVLVAGLALMSAAVAPSAYVDSTYAVLGGRARPPRGLERI